MQSQQESLKFDLKKYWPKLLEEVIGEPKFRDIKNSLVWLGRVLANNVLQGKQNRGLAQLYVYRALVPQRTEEEDFLSSVLGWCSEILQGCAIIADDVMDSSETRRGSPCWYKVEGVGLSAINDAFLLENIVYYILSKYFGQKDYYLDLLHLIQDTGLKTVLGQSLDTRMSLTQNWDDYTEENYATIVKYKTSYYSFYAPIAGAMIMAGLTDQSIFEAVENIVLKMGHLFQAQDDYLDCFGDFNITGKIGTDIIEGKCTWLLVEAIKRASETQLQILKNCYGSRQAEDEEKVKRIYTELKLKNLFRTFEDNEFNEILQLIQELDEFPQEPLHSFLTRIYKRNK